MRKQTRHGVGFAKKWSGFTANQIGGLQERALDFTIAKGERMLSRSIFLTELLAELRWMEKSGQLEKAPTSVEELMAMDKSKIPMEAVEYAQTKVSDHMGVADQAKKGYFFQNRTTSPTWNALLRSVVRFSNHQATTSSGMSAMLPMLWNAETGADGKLTQGGQRAREEAIENIVGTVMQNSLFHVMKLKVLVPIVLSILLGGDDDEEKAQEMADKLMFPEEYGNPVANAAKAVVFGKQSQFFRDEKSPEASQASAYAELASNVISEWIPMAHPTAAAFGYYPFSNAFKSIVTNSIVQDGVAKMTGLDSAQSRYQDDAVYIYERYNSGIQTAMGRTAPGAIAYDLGAAGILAAEASMTEGASTLDIIGFIISQVLPVTRELRGRMEQKIEEPVWEERGD